MGNKLNTGHIGLLMTKANSIVVCIHKSIAGWLQENIILLSDTCEAASGVLLMLGLPSIKKQID